MASDTDAPVDLYIAAKTAWRQADPRLASSTEIRPKVRPNLEERNCHDRSDN